MNFIEHFGLNALLSSLDGLAYLIGYIAGLFVTVGGTLVNWTLSQNATLLTSNTVQTGFIVSRDLANLGFVLAIILIAFATILRFEQYQMQRILWKLIVAALLVNFSLVIAGVFIDFSGVMTNFFIEKAAGGTVGEGLANAFNVQSILQQTTEESKIKALVQGLKEDPNKHYPFTASVVFVAIFTTIVAISLISLAAMLYIRYIWLTILLILAPLAWLMWIWPDLEHLQKEWWSKFMQWTLFGPAVTFFIYLAIAVALKGGIAPVGSSLDEAIGVTIKDFGTMLAKMISVLGILYGGMYTANTMGIAGANAGFAVAKGVKNLMVGGAVVGAGLAGGLGLKLGGRLYEGANKTLLGRETNFREDLKNITARASGIPLVGGAMQAANRALQEGGAEIMKKLEEHYGGLTSFDARLNSLRDVSLVDPEKKAALINSMAIKNELGQLEEAIKKGLISRDRYEEAVKSSLLKGGEGAKTLLSRNPFLAKLKMGSLQDHLAAGGTEEEYNKTTEGEVLKALSFMKPEAAETIPLDALKENPAYLAKLDKGSVLNRILERSTEDADKFVEILEDHLKNIDQIPKEIADKLSRLGNRISGTPAWSGVKQINPDLLKGTAPVRPQAPPGPRSSTEPVPGLNLNPPK